MLRVSIHAGPLRLMDVSNRLDWLDIGYGMLAPVADYQAVLFCVGEGIRPPVVVKGYPRWSASLWDLVTRVIALSLAPDPKAPREEVPPWPEKPKHVAWAERVCAVVEHCPAGTETRSRLLASAEVWRHGRMKGTYRARFEEDCMPVREVAGFTFRPQLLRPAELVLHAALMRLSGQHERMPPRPSVATPEVVKDGLPYVPLHRLPEPARTGFSRWLQAYSEPPLAHAGAPDGIAPAPSYLKFLSSAV